MFDVNCVSKIALLIGNIILSDASIVTIVYCKVSVDFTILQYYCLKLLLLGSKFNSFLYCDLFYLLVLLGIIISLNIN